jgi:hypothetical protein
MRWSIRTVVCLNGAEMQIEKKYNNNEEIKEEKKN